MKLYLNQGILTRYGHLPILYAKCEWLVQFYCSTPEIFNLSVKKNGLFEGTQYSHYGIFERQIFQIDLN